MRNHRMLSIRERLEAYVPTQFTHALFPLIEEEEVWITWYARLSRIECAALTSYLPEWRYRKFQLPNSPLWFSLLEAHPGSSGITDLRVKVFRNTKRNSE